MKQQSLSAQIRCVAPEWLTNVRWFALIVSLAVLLGTETGQAGSTNGLSYTVTTNGSITIAGYTCPANPSALVIPSSIEGLPVTSIGDSAFSQCSQLTDITIPGSVTNIGIAAFQKCWGLTTVTFLGDVAKLGSYCFDDCTLLSNITIPTGVTNIGDFTFEGCTSLTNFTIPSGVMIIGDGAFFFVYQSH